MLHEGRQQLQHWTTAGRLFPDERDTLSRLAREAAPTFKAELNALLALRGE